MSAARGPRGPYARRSVTYVVWVLSIVLVVALAVGGYEINHQRSEINSLHSQVQGQASAITKLYIGIAQLNAAVTKLEAK